MRRTEDELLEDLARLSDKVHKLQKEKNLMARELLEYKDKLKDANRRVWLLSLVVGPVASEAVKMILRALFK